MLSNAEHQNIYDCDGEGGLVLPDLNINSIDLRFKYGIQRWFGLENIVYLLPVTLEDLYNGCTRIMPVKRLCICKACEGTGRKYNIKNVICSACQGLGRFHECCKNGVKAKLCGMCHGAGKLVIPSYVCEICDGNKMVWNQFALNVPVEKGMKSGHSVIYRQCGHQFPDGRIGHLIFLINTAEHPVFKRSGYDLTLEVEVSEEEALCGFTKYFKTLDGRWIEIHALPGELFRLPIKTKRIMNEGMPLCHNTNQKGDLEIQFIVQHSIY